MMAREGCRVKEIMEQKNGISILGKAVIVEDEVVVLSSTVLPHKALNQSVRKGDILVVRHLLKVW